VSKKKKRNGGTSDDECGCLRVVLLCKGKGADKDSYRPRSDESQWWGRRDALVRCVASFLFGATDSNDNRNQSNKTKKELVLLFDEDLARLHMTLDSGGDSDNDNDNNNNNNPRAFPKEQTILQLWKRAAQNLRTTVEYGGMKCVIHLDPSLSLSPNPQSTPSSGSKGKGKGKGKGTKGSNTKGGIEKIDTKRAVLEFLQKNVSVEFLREHRLNSHPDVVLRKTNRNALLKVWDAWTKQSTEADATDGKSDKTMDGNTSGSPDSRRLTRIYRELLRFPSGESSRRGSSSSTPSPRVIVAGTLHETCEEFPCFGPRAESDATYHACLFLGAVRDMTSHEQRILEKVCGASGIPLVGVRFGTVPEFTSKILSLLAFHHANGVLDIALTRLLDAAAAAAAEAAKEESSGRSLTESSQPQEQLQSTCLHVVCTVPASSKSVSIDMDQRDEIHWRLVRVIVCSLWRSKLASSKSAVHIHHTNSLRLVFDDGIVVLLEERRFVDQLASQHRAAPSEHQILAALIREIDRQSQSQTPPVSSSSSSSSSWRKNLVEDRGWSRKKLAKLLVKDVVESSPIPITCAIGIESSRPKQETNHNMDELVSRFYHHSSDDAGADIPAPARARDASDHGLLLAVSIPPPSNPSPGRPSAFVGRRRPRPAGDEQHHRCEPPRMYRELLSALNKRQIPTLEQRLFPDHCSAFTDREASSIIALQHMCYQNRAFGSTCGPPTTASTTEISGKKRKKPSYRS